MLKLNDFLNPENGDKGLALLRSIKNSLKRNTILPTVDGARNRSLMSEYQSKLSNHNVSYKDLLIIFDHIYRKDEMSISDRNFIRRILLTIFPQKLISAGGKALIQHTSFLSLSKGERMNGDSKFYLVLKGSLKIVSPFYHRKVVSGQYFGHHELMTGLPADSFSYSAQSEAYLITVSKQGFHSTLLSYFREIYKTNLSLVPRIISEKLEPIQVILLCDKMQKRSFPIGCKTSKKGEPVQEVLFIEEGKLSSNIDFQSIANKVKVDKTIGLSEVLLEEPKYLTNSFTLQQTKGSAISVEDFVRIVTQPILNQVRQQLIQASIENSCLAMNRSKVALSPIGNREKSQQSQTEVLNKFTKVRKVNLSYCKSKSTTKTQPRQSTQMSRMPSISKYEASFIFIKGCSTPSRMKECRLNRSHVLSSEQVLPVRYYLDNIHVPSLEPFKECAL